MDQGGVAGCLFYGDGGVGRGCCAQNVPNTDLKKEPWTKEVRLGASERGRVAVVVVGKNNKEVWLGACACVCVCCRGLLWAERAQP